MARGRVGLVAVAALVLPGCLDLGLPDVPADGGVPAQLDIVEPASDAVVPLTTLVSIEASSIHGIQAVTVGCGTGIVVAAWTLAPFSALVDLSPCQSSAGPADPQTGLSPLTLVATVVDGLGRAGTQSRNVKLDGRLASLRVEAPGTVTPHSSLEVKVTPDRPLSSTPTVQLEGQNPSSIQVVLDGGTQTVYLARFDDTPGLGTDALPPGTPVTFEELTETERPLRLTVDARSAENGNLTHLVLSLTLTRVAWDRPSAGRLGLAAAEAVSTADGVQVPLATDDLVPTPSSRWLPGLFLAGDGTFVAFDPGRLPGGLDGGYLARGMDASGRTLFSDPTGTALSFLPSSFSDVPMSFTVPFPLPTPLTRLGPALCPPDVLGGTPSAGCFTGAATQVLDCVAASGPVTGLGGTTSTLSLGSPSPGTTAGSGSAYLAPAGPGCGDLWAAGTLGGSFIFAGRADPDRPGCSFLGVRQLLPVGDGTFIAALDASCGGVADFPVVRADATGAIVAGYVFPRTAPAPVPIQPLAALADGSLVTMRNDPPSTVFELWQPGATVAASAALVPGLYAMVPGAEPRRPVNVSPRLDGSLSVLLSGGPNGTAVAHFGPGLTPRWLYFYPRPLAPSDAPRLIGAPELEDAYLLDARNQRVVSLRAGGVPPDGGASDAGVDGGVPDAGVDGGVPDAGAVISCVGPGFFAFYTFDTNAVVNGCTVTSFDTRVLGDAGVPKRYCLLSIQNYHYNNANGATPGFIGLFDVLADQAYPRGPFQSFHPSFGGGQYEWMIDFTADAGPQGPIVLDGVYQVTDSDPATWSGDPLAGDVCFTAVFVQEASP